MPTAFVFSSVYRFLFSLYWLCCHNGWACGAVLAARLFCWRNVSAGWPACQACNAGMRLWYIIHLLSVVWTRWVSVSVCSPACLIPYIYVSLWRCDWFLCLHCLMWVPCECMCVPVGVAREPQFLCGPICFVLFVLLINEIRGAACWDGPAAPPRWTGPLSLGLTLLSKWMPSSPSCLLFLFHCTSLLCYWLELYIYIFTFVFQFVTLVDARGHIRWLLVVA